MKYKKEVESINSYYHSKLADKHHPPSKCLSVIKNLKEFRKSSWNCPYTSSWSAWSSCAHSGVKCGTGTRYHTRNCKLKSNKVKTVPNFMCESVYSPKYSKTFKSSESCFTDCKQKWTGL